MDAPATAGLSDVDIPTDDVPPENIVGAKAWDYELGLLINLSIYLSIYLPIYLSTYLSTYIDSYTYIDLSCYLY